MAEPQPWQKNLINGWRFNSPQLQACTRKGVLMQLLHEEVLQLTSTWGPSECPQERKRSCQKVSSVSEGDDGYATQLTLWALTASSGSFTGSQATERRERDGCKVSRCYPKFWGSMGSIFTTSRHGLHVYWKLSNRLSAIQAAFRPNET